MRIDVSLLSLSGNSLRRLRRLAPWSIVTLVIGALLLAVVALGSAQGNAGFHHREWGGHDRGGAGSADPQVIIEQSMRPQKLNVTVGDHIAIYYEQGWSQVILRGTALRWDGNSYVAAHPGTAVLTAQHGKDEWKYTIAVLPAG